MFDEALAALLSGGVSIALASASGSRPSLARGLGCRVARDGRLTLFVLASQAAALLADVRASGVLALAFTQPSTHHAWQFKGSDATVDGLRRGDAGRVAAYGRAFVEAVRPLGYREEAVRTLLAFTPGDLAVVSFTPACAFLQTPGVGAGDPLPEVS